MNSERFEDLERRATLIEPVDEARQLEARSRVKREIKKMLAEGEAYELTHEEERMIQSFRRFKLRMRKDGEVFTWQTRRPDGIQIVEETAQIVHPAEAPVK